MISCMIRRISIAAGCLACFISCKNDDRTSSGRTPSAVAAEVETARQAVTVLSTDVYAAWTRHPGETCPETLADLTGKPDADNFDPWGTRYGIICGGAVTGGPRFGVMSAGPDGKGGTADDINSW